MSKFENLVIPDIDWTADGGVYFISLCGWEAALDMGFFMAICDHLDYHRARE